MFLLSWDSVTFCRPVAEINLAAALATKGTPGIFLRPEGFSTTSRAIDMPFPNFVHRCLTPLLGSQEEIFLMVMFNLVLQGCQIGIIDNDIIRGGKPGSPSRLDLQNGIDFGI